MTDYSAADWEGLFIAEAGASAALAGLLFVAVSINLTKILEVPGRSGRAGRRLCYWSPCWSFPPWDRCRASRRRCSAPSSTS
jgi:hypothetical protein